MERAHEARDERRAQRLQTAARAQQRRRARPRRTARVVGALEAARARPVEPPRGGDLRGARQRVHMVEPLREGLGDGRRDTPAAPLELEGPLDRVGLLGHAAERERGRAAERLRRRERLPAAVLQGAAEHEAPEAELRLHRVELRVDRRRERRAARAKGGAAVGAGLLQRLEQREVGRRVRRRRDRAGRRRRARRRRDERLVGRQPLDGLGAEGEVAVLRGQAQAAAARQLERQPVRVAREQRRRRVRAHRPGLAVGRRRVHEDGKAVGRLLL